MSKPVSLGAIEVIDIETGEVVERQENAATLLPAPPGTCEECAVEHDPRLPHNQQSMFYQMRFHALHGRWPTWTDAMQHCEPALREDWRASLIELLRSQGVDVPPDLNDAESN